MRCPPQGIHVRFPPPRLVATVTARDYFSTTGDKRVLVSNNIIRVGFQGMCRPFLTRDALPTSVTAKKKCYSPPTSVTCVLPRERKVLSTAKRNRKQSVLCYLHVHVCNIFMMVLALLEEHHVFVERCCCATTWYVRRAHAQDKSPPSQY